MVPPRCPLDRGLEPSQPFPFPDSFRNVRKIPGRTVGFWWAVRGRSGVIFPILPCLTVPTRSVALANVFWTEASHERVHACTGHVCGDTRLSDSAGSCRKPRASAHTRAEAASLGSRSDRGPCPRGSGLPLSTRVSPARVQMVSSLRLQLGLLWREALLPELQHNCLCLTDDASRSRRRVLSRQNVPVRPRPFTTPQTVLKGLNCVFCVCDGTLFFRLLC